MKIVILHGDHVVDSYARLCKYIDIAKSRGWDVQKTSDSAKSLPEIIVSENLFQTQRLIVVDNIKSFDKNTSTWLKEHAENLNTNIVFYHKGPVSKTLLNSLPKTDKVEEYKIPQKLWNFLDSFTPGNAKLTLLLLDQVVKKEPIEFVFSLLAKQLRDLYWVKKDPKNMSYPVWRIDKFKKQASKFSEEKLRKVISYLADADIKSKTSQDNMRDMLDFIIIRELE